MKDQGIPGKFKVFVGFERHRDCRQLTHEEVFQVGVRYIAGRDQQELMRSVNQQEGVDEIRVSSYYHSSVVGRQLVDLLIGSAIALGQVERVEYVMARITQPVRQPAGELRVN